MKAGWAALGVVVACGSSSSGGPPPYTPPEGFVTNQRIVYSDGLHNENTQMLALDDRILLVFRGGETGQIGSDKAHLNVYASMDGGQTFTKQSEVSAASLPGGRDIRDPKLVPMNGKVYLYAISRVPGGHYRDLLGNAWTVRAESSDKGVTWTDPVKTYSDVNGAGAETYWGFWRIMPRSYTDAGGPKTSLYALGYDDDDTSVALFVSDDGITWTKQSVVVDSYDDVPSESELQFYGDNQQTAVAIVRMDNQGILQDGQSAICTSQAPFTAWECGRRIETRLDGPTWFSGDVGGKRREFVIARKHLPCTDKRTAVYELRGDLSDPTAKVQVCEIEVLKSAGDTAYTGLVHLGADRYLASWYSSVIPATGDVPWLLGTYSPSDIWLAEVDFSKAPTDTCNPPPPKTACPAAHIPDGSSGAAASGDFILTIAPEIAPTSTLSFDTTVTANGGTVDFSLQPLDATTHQAIGEPWTAAAVPVDGNGHFSASFGIVKVPSTAFPLLSDPFLTLHDLVLDGVMRSGGFCGDVSGFAQVLGQSVSDQIDLRGSTFGAVAAGAMPVAACN